MAFIVPQFAENSGFAEYLAQLRSQGGFEPNKIHFRDFLTAYPGGGRLRSRRARIHLSALHLNNSIDVEA